jgi:aryl-alcohol dehydrogenase-like predicted oxidoreductase
LSKAHIRQAVEDSLRRLQTDYIDLYQSHADAPATPQEETLDAYAEPIKQGRIRAIGASNFSAGYDSTLAPICREHGLGVLCYYSLASSFLTGKYRSGQDLADLTAAVDLRLAP